jgi:Zn-finger protein
MFCFCPLYHYKNCGGEYEILKKNGLKDCSNCLVPHSPDGYEYIVKFLKESAIKYGNLNNRI